MRWVTVGRLFRLVLILLLPVSAASGQNTPPPQLQPRTAEPAKVQSPTSTDREITLDVQVTDKSGAPVRGLQKQDFTVLDDKQPQNILSFHAVDKGAASTTDPAEIVLVVDAVNTSFNAITYARSELKKFLLQNGGRLAQPVSLVIFIDTETKMQGGLLATEMPWRRYTTNTKPDCGLSTVLKASMAQRIVLTSRSRP